MSSSDYALLKKAIRHENQREKISKHQERYMSQAKHRLAIQRQSLEQNRNLMIQLTHTLSPAMQKYYHERLTQLAERQELLGGNLNK